MQRKLNLLMLLSREIQDYVVYIFNYINKIYTKEF